MSCQKDEEKKVRGHGVVSDSKEEEIGHLGMEEEFSSHKNHPAIHTPMRVIKKTTYWNSVQIHELMDMYMC